jgi:hypothetical protein
MYPSSYTSITSCPVLTVNIVLLPCTAAEWVLKQCTSQMTGSGEVVPLGEGEKNELLVNVVTRMAQVRRQ